MSAAHCYRLTKYDPANRDADGRYLRDEWTFFAQVGEAVDGRELTLAEYERVEGDMIDGVLALLDDSGIDSLQVADLESGIDGTHAPFVDGAMLATSALAPVLRDALREKYWCRLRGIGAYVHFGHDYYVYIGLPREPGDATRGRIAATGLFLEACKSPYVVVAA